jgi:transposase-like protein
MTQQRYPEEFKIEAVRQVTQRGHSVAEVAGRLGVSRFSLYKWIQAQGMLAGQRQEQVSQAEELRRLRAELKRVAEERDILKSSPRTLPSSPGEVRIH